MVTALITGASSGLGAEYARQLAARGADLVLVARDLEALDAVAGAIRACHRVKVEVVSADLAVSDEVDRVAARLTAADAPVELLVNNAGFGLPLDFAANDVAREVDHLRVHVEAPLRLSHAALEGMLARGHGRIVNVASVAAYLPHRTRPRSPEGLKKNLRHRNGRWYWLRTQRRAQSCTACSIVSRFPAWCMPRPTPFAMNGPLNIFSD